MVARTVLLIHPDEARRRELRSWLRNETVLEADSRQAAVRLLAHARPAFVLTHHADFKKLLKDLERHAPGAVRAVLFSKNNDSVRQQLIDVAAEGYDFVTIDEGDADAVQALIQSRRSSRLEPEHPLTAQFHVDGGDCFGVVVDVSNSGAGIMLDVSAPVDQLTPGTRLQRASVRRGDAVVMEPRDWVVRTVRTAPHRKGVLIGVSFEPAKLDERPKERVTDAVKLRGLLRRAILRSAPFELQRVDDGQRSTAERSVLHVGEGTLSLHGLQRPPEPGAVVRLSFEAGGFHYESVTSVVSRRDAAVVVALPSWAMRQERRSSLRMRGEAAGEATLRVAALGGAVSDRAVIDLHPGGAAFSFDPITETFPPGLVLTPIELVVRGRSISCRAVVQGTAELGDGRPLRRCGIRFQALSPQDRQFLLDALVTSWIPDISDGGLVEFDRIWALFEGEGVRFPDYPYESPRTLEVLRAAHRAAGDGRHGLTKSFVFRQGEEVLGHTSGLRIYSKTWVSQHLAVRSGYSRASHISQSLVNLSFDYGESLGDIEYMRGLWRTANRWTSRIYGAATAKLIHPGTSYLATFTPMRRPVATPMPPPTLAVRTATRDDESRLLLVLRQTEDTVRLRASDLVDGELHLESLQARYAAIGLSRTRRIFAAEGPGGDRAWALLEDMSPGLFWAEMYGGFRLVLAEPNGPEADALRAALVSHVVSAVAARGSAVAECLANAEDVPTLTALGFESQGLVVEFGAHRTLARDMANQMLLISERLTSRAARHRSTEETE